MNFKPTHAPGATLLDPDEMNGLIPNYISTQGELNILEQENILSGNIDQESPIRDTYIAALKLADQKQFSKLIQFVYF